MLPSNKQSGQLGVSSNLDATHNGDRQSAMWAAATPVVLRLTQKANPRVRIVRGLHAKF